MPPMMKSPRWAGPQPALDLASQGVLGRDPAALTRPHWFLVKRLIDMGGASALLLLLAPLLLAVALTVKLGSRGPLLFRQQRYGRDRRSFTVLKFRTMHDGASSDPHRLYIQSLADADGGGDGLKKLTDDPRITRFGAFLRRMSLDELPQLVNVVRGEMSLIGPRPALYYELEYYDAEHFARFDVRPGMTGLWQVSGRSTLGFREMLDLDAEYARRAGPMLDAVILMRTPSAVLGRRAA